MKEVRTNNLVDREIPKELFNSSIKIIKEKDAKK